MIRSEKLPTMRTLLVTGVLLALLIPNPAPAADKKQGSFGTGKAAGAYLTREQLRVCLAQQARVAQSTAQMLAEQAALATLKAEIARSGEALKDKLDSIDRSSADAVAAYNEQASARDKQIDDYQAGVTAFNARVEGERAEREAFGKGCDNRRYFEEDEIAIKRGK